MQTRFFNTTRPANPSAAISPRLLDALVLLVLGLNYYYVRLLVALMPDVVGARRGGADCGPAYRMLL